MVFKGLIAATAAVALMVTPTMAAATRSATVAQAAAVAPADETVDGDNELFGRRGFVVPLLAIIAIILGLCAAEVICDRDDDLPESP